MTVGLPDLLRPRLAEVSHVVACFGEPADIERLTALPDRVALTCLTEAPLQPLRDDELLLVLHEASDPLASLTATLGALTERTTALLLLRWRLLDLPWPAIVDAVSAAGCQVVDVSSIASQKYPLCAVVRRPASLMVPAGQPVTHVERPADSDVSAMSLSRRLASELVFVHLRERELRAAVDRLHMEVAALKRTHAAAAEEAARRAAQNAAAVTATAARAEQRVAELTEELDRLRASPTMAVGRAVVDARRPAGAVRLVGELLRLRRARR
jgi:hypothetical protein